MIIAFRLHLATRHLPTSGDDRLAPKEKMRIQCLDRRICSLSSSRRVSQSSRPWEDGGAPVGNTARESTARHPACHPDRNMNLVLVFVFSKETDEVEKFYEIEGRWRVGGASLSCETCRRRRKIQTLPPFDRGMFSVRESKGKKNDHEARDVTLGHRGVRSSAWVTRKHRCHPRSPTSNRRNA